MLTDTNPTREECEFLIRLVNFLETCAEKHSQFEEECMESHRCAAHVKNKQAHEVFMMFFQRFKERTLTEGFRPEVLRSMHQTMSLWIQEHILQIDTQLRPCFAAAAEPALVTG